MQSKSLIDQILQWYSNNKDKYVQPLRPAIYDFYAAVRGSLSALLIVHWRSGACK